MYVKRERNLVRNIYIYIYTHTHLYTFSVYIHIYIYIYVYCVLNGRRSVCIFVIIIIKIINYHEHKYRPQDGLITGRNMLLNIPYIKIQHKIKVHLLLVHTFYTPNYYTQYGAC
jgi:hypothetical protein